MIDVAAILSDAKKSEYRFVRLRAQAIEEEARHLLQHMVDLGTGELQLDQLRTDIVLAKRERDRLTSLHSGSTVTRNATTGWKVPSSAPPRQSV